MDVAPYTGDKAGCLIRARPTTKAVPPNYVVVDVGNLRC